MTGFVDDIEGRAEDNHDFRQVLYTGLHMQLVLMSLLPGEETGEEVHEHTDEFLHVEAAEALRALRPDRTPGRYGAPDQARLKTAGGT